MNTEQSKAAMTTEQKAEEYAKENYGLLGERLAYLAGDANARLECAGIWVNCGKHLPGYVTDLHKMNNSNIIVRRVDNKSVIKEYFNLYGAEWGLENFEWFDASPESPSPNPLEAENERLKKQLQESLLLYQNMCNTIVKREAEKESALAVLKELVALKDMEGRYTPVRASEILPEKVNASYFIIRHDGRKGIGTLLDPDLWYDGKKRTWMVDNDYYHADVEFWLDKITMSK
jgi:hypothetical protein